MALAAWDAAAIYISYNLTYLVRIGRWQGFSLGLAVVGATWLSTSYLVGRYSPPEESEDNKARYLGKILVAAGAVIAVFVGHSWAYQIVDAQTRFRGFLIPLIGSICSISIFGHGAVLAMARSRRRWILVAYEEERDVVLEEIELQDSRHKSIFVTSAEDAIKRINDTKREATGLAVGSVGGNEQKDVECLLRLREKGECVIPLISWCETELQRIPPELVHPEWLIQAEGFGLRPGSYSWRIKRLGDVIGAFFLIGLTAPVIIVAVISVWLEDRGPVFYKQKRSGLFGKPILIWKIRSMRVNAEEKGAQWASRMDVRITRVGKLIRATRIDELPQLFSVLKGDLSLIGPRPERPEIEEELERKIANYRMRHWIRPGLSGWAQVCFPYGASVSDSRMKLSYDLFYLRNANWALDLLITMKTIRLVVSGRGSAPNQQVRGDHLMSHGQHG